MVEAAPLQILVVDDNVDLAENVAELFADGKHRVRVAHNGAEAKVMVDEELFELAVVDVRLPDTSGVELAAELSERVPEGEIILMTANASLDSAIAAVSLLVGGQVFAQSLDSTEPTNDLPNEYQAIDGWAKMPVGRDWGSTSAVDIDPDGRSIWVAEPTPTMARSAARARPRGWRWTRPGTSMVPRSGPAR